MPFGCQSMVGKIERLLLKHARDAFGSQENIQAQSKELKYTGPPDYELAVREYDRFAELLALHIPEIRFLPASDQVGLDSIYLHDPVIVTERGAILCRMGKELRRSEPEVIGRFLPELGIPILGAITGAGTLEGGDVVWIDRRTLAVGRGGRTNGEGIRQLRKLTEGLVDRLIQVVLPGSVMHLMSLLSVLDEDLAIVHSTLLPESFRECLVARGMKLIEVPLSEYDRQACNILAIDRRKCLALSGNPLTKELLREAGVEVLEFDGEEIALKGEGGPTCLTRPLLRS